MNSANHTAYCAMGLAFGALGPSLENIVEKMKGIDSVGTAGGSLSFLLK